MKAKKLKLILVTVVMSAYTVIADAQGVKPAIATVAEPALTIEVAGKKTKFGAAELGKLKRHTIKTKDHGTDATFEGFAMADVLTAAGVELGEKLRGKRMTEYIVVEAADNYRAVFALAEFDASFTDNVIILADKRDGKGLPDNARPWQIVVPNEKRAARWVRQVVSMEVLTAN